MLALMMLVIGTWLSSPAWAATYYVAPEPVGNNANTGTSEGSPWAYTKGWSAVLSAGDVVMFLPGTYNAAFRFWTGENPPPNGTDANNRVVFMAKPINRTCSGHNPADVTTCYGSTYEEVLIHPVNASASGASMRIAGDRQWLTIEGLKFLGTGAGGKHGISIAAEGNVANDPPACVGASTRVGPNRLRFLNIQVKGFANSGIIGHEHTDTEILNSIFEFNGDSDLDHGMYLSGVNMLIDRAILRNNSGTGAQFYRQVTQPTCIPRGNGVVFQRGRVYDNTRGGLHTANYIHNTTIRNSVVYRNAFGITVDSSFESIGHKVYNNTAMHNAGAGLRILQRGDFAIIKNNIFNGQLSIDGGATDLTIENNYAACSTCAQPAFVDPTNGDYRLQSGDARIDAGQNLTSVGVTQDIDGIARPQGSAFDLGAYEFTTSGSASFDFAMVSDVVEEEEPTVIQGQTSAAIVVTATKLAGTAASVVFSAANLPPQATATFDPASCAPTTTTCTTSLTVTTANATPEGGYDIQVRGVSGTVVRTTSVPINVTCN
jgi:hypothetical protein